MREGLKRWLKRLPMARQLWHALRPKGRAERIDARDRRQIRQILRRVLQAQANCVDVGAHSGEFLAEMVGLAPGGRHLAIEPITQLAETLRARFPGISVHNVALGSVAGMVSFQHVESNPAFSGLIRRPDLDPKWKVNEVQVRCVTLDELVPPEMRVTLLKVDVEGAEAGVFRGGRRVLRESRPWIVFEHGGVSESTYGVTSLEIFEELEQHGLSVWQMDHWLATKPSLTREAFDSVVRRGEVWNFLAGPAEKARAKG
jgi:FkbM family methyltransferase